MNEFNYQIYEGDPIDIIIEDGIETLIGSELKTTGMTETIVPGKTMCFRYEDIKNCMTITMPDSVKVIGPKTFAGCKKLIGLELSTKLETIHMGAFENCSSLKFIELPTSLTKIEGWAFANDSIEEIYYSGSIINLDKLIEKGAAVDIKKIHCTDCEVDFTKDKYIEEFNYPGTVSQWNESAISQWIKNRTKKIICTDGEITL